MTEGRRHGLASCRGLTLLEIMVVLVIIGVIVGVVGFSMDTRQRQLEIEGERLAALLKLAREEAILSEADLAVEFSLDGYQFYQWRQTEWQPLNEGVFRPRQLESDVQFELHLPVENEHFLPQVEIDGEIPSPRVYFYADGEATPFELTMETISGKRLFRLTCSIQGVIEEAIGEE
jgi:general secretion pathway protein H